MKNQEEKKKKVRKGDYGYIRNRMIKQILFTVLLFTVSILLFLAGWITTDTKKNLLTIVAVLGMLPASKSLVQVIMYVKAHGCSQDFYNKINGEADSLRNACDFVFTTYEKTYEVSHVVIRNGNVCGCSERIADQELLNTLNKHITDSLAKAGLKMSVKIFNNQETYLQRIKQLRELEDEKQTGDAEAMQVLFEISL